MEPLAVGVDVGGTLIKACLATRSGEIEQEWTFPTRTDLGPEGVVPHLVSTVASLVEQVRSERGEPVGMGLVIPGQVDESAGIAVFSGNILWRDVPLRELLGTTTDVAVALGHDVRAGAIAESTWGAARSQPSALFVPLGTGVAAAFVNNGVVLRGAHGQAGEIGHLQLAVDDYHCECGRRRCLETISSASAIARRYSAAVGATHTAEQVADLATRGDAVALRVWNEAVGALAEALVATSLVLDPAVVVVGGGLSSAGATLFEPLVAAVRERGGPGDLIVPAHLGSRAGMLGAALMAWQAHQ